MEQLIQHLENTLSQLPITDAFRHLGDNLGEFVFYGLIANFLLATILHRLGCLTIFQDDEDATITNLSPGLIIALYFLFQSTSMAPDWEWYLIGATLLAYLAIVAQITFSANRSSSLFFLMAYVAKLTGVIVFYLAIFIALFFILKKVFGATRSERREAAQIAGLASMAGGLMYWWAHKVTGSRRVSPIQPRSALPQRMEEVG